MHRSYGDRCSVNALCTSTYQEQSYSTSIPHSPTNQIGDASTEEIVDGTLKLHKSAFNKYV